MLCDLVTNETKEPFVRLCWNDLRSRIIEDKLALRRFQHAIVGTLFLCVLHQAVCMSRGFAIVQNSEPEQE